MAAVYDRMMQKTEEACLAAWRTELVGRATGEVLEVGAGTGANVPYYTDVERVLLAEPDAHMRERLEQSARRARGRRFEVAAHSAERLPYDDAAFDTVVSTLVMCSVADLASSLGEVQRVLKPGGRFVFIEHVAAAPGSSRRRWQGRIEPFWLLMAGNCHLTRMTEAAIAAAGLSIDTIERESLRKALPWVRPSVRGVAVKRA